jgi:peptidoglycan/LPS O-acetylase OafA/YrhL
MEFRDAILLFHPVIAVLVVFPLIGIVVNRALQTRQRRLETQAMGKSKIPPIVGPEHVQIGRWLTGSVISTVLLALANDILGNILDKHIWITASFQVIFIVLLFAATIASMVLLYKAKERNWRAIFATLTGMGLVVLGCQDGVYRKTDQWYISHYYYGLTAALLMIFSLAILPDIYKDRSNFWRKVHITLNCIALLIFLGQGISGTRALLEIPLTWQEPYIQQLYEKKCDTKPCTIQAPTLPEKP